MTRLKDWQPRLIEYLASMARDPFLPYHHDCARWADGAYYAMTGKSLWPSWAKEYSSLKDGIKLLRAHGFRNHIHYVENFLKECPPAMAYKGDIAVLDGDVTGGTLGIVQGELVYVLGDGGTATMSRLSIRRAFRV